MQSVSKAEKLAHFYKTNPYRAAELIKTNDYIESPKPDGYRSIHLVYRYRGAHQGGAYKGMKIEVQLRSRLQHAWATAVETIDTFTGQALKSNIGDEAWKRFFVIMGSAIATIERRRIVPNSPPTFNDLVTELKSLCQCCPN